MDAWRRIRLKSRVEAETAERMAFAHQHIQAATQAEKVAEPKQSPWYLGGEFLNKEEDK